MKKDEYRDQISHDPENESDVDMGSIVDESFDLIHDLSSNHTTTAHLPLLIIKAIHDKQILMNN